MDSTTALSYGLPFLDSDLLMSNTSSSLSIFALSNSLPPVRVEHLHLGQGEVERGERGHDQVGGAARVCLCSMVLRPVERLVFSPKER